MDKKYEEIIAFAELQAFQDRPFKQLSSGMKSRLAFSIACLVNPDILILDEVLSVGDGAFRKKSGDKMKRILESGVTGMLVSHSVPQVRELCNKILWLDHGKQVTFTENVALYCDAYEEFLNTKQLPKNEEDIQRLADAYKVRKELDRQTQMEKSLRKVRRDASRTDMTDEAVSLAHGHPAGVSAGGPCRTCGNRNVSDPNKAIAF